MTTLHLGVIDQPYPRGKKSTGDVAEILEAKYHLFETFFIAHQMDVFDPQIRNSIEGALESLLMGHTVDPWGPAAQAIQQRFRDFINSGEAERVNIPGTPTKAALRGVSHRKAHPYSRDNGRRPSFRDTGLFVDSVRVWVD